MAGFDPNVNAPQGASFAPQPLSFAGFGQWAQDDPYANIFKRQQQQANQQRLQAGWQQGQLAQAFPNGLPMKDGVVDYTEVAKTMAKFGDIGGAMQTMQQAPPPLSPLVGSQGDASPAVMTPKIIHAESGGNPNSQDPNSTAGGLGGFTDSTWVETIKRNFPNLAEGRSDAQLIAMKKIPALATRVTEAFTANNQEGLTKAGLPVTPMTTYLSHFAGLGGAKKVLNADPNTPVEKLLSADAMAANPFLRGMTARDLELWANRKMLGPAMTAQNQQGAAPAQVAGQPTRVRIQQPAQQEASAAPGDLPPSANAGTPAPQAQPFVQPQQQEVQPQPETSPFAMMAAGQPPAQPPMPMQPPQPPAPPAAPQQPLVPPEQLPRGFKPGQEMQAIQALRKEQLRYSHMPNGQTDAKFYGDWAKRIQDSIAPIAVRPGETFVSPTDARTIYQAPQANLKDLALRRFMEEHPDATAAEIQKFNAQGRPQRSSAAMALQRYIEEHPDATSEDIQKFTAAQTAITRFGSGKQGDTIKSFNVLVDHLGTLDEASQALKNGDIRRFNSWKQTWASETGETAPTNFDGVKALVGDEIVKAVVGSAGALADREEVKKDLSRVSSPKQLSELVDHYRKLALGQLKGLRKEFTSSTGLTEKDFNDKLLPGTLSSLGGAGGGGRGMGGVTPGGLNWSVVQ